MNSERSTPALQSLPRAEAAPAAMEALEGHSQRFAHIVARRVREDIPEYRDLDLPSVLEGAERTFRSFFALARQPSADIDRSAFDLGREAATRRVQQLPIEVLLRAWRIFERVGWELIAGEARSHPGGAELMLSITPLWLRLFDQATSAATAKYVTEQQRLLAREARAKRDLVEDLLAGRISSREAEARMTGWGLPSANRYVLLIARVSPQQESGTQHQSDAIAEALIRRQQAQGLMGFTVVRHEEVLSVLPARDEELSVTEGVGEVARSLRDLDKVQVHFGVSGLFTSLGLVRDAYREAQSALRLASETSPVVAFSQVSLYQYLVTQADHEAARLVAPGVQKLVEEDARQDYLLINTLAAYVDADLQANAAASLLHVHPNTVYYRIGKIEEISGCNPRAFWDLVNLLIGSQILMQHTPARGLPHRPAPFSPGSRA